MGEFFAYGEKLRFRSAKFRTEEDEPARMGGSPVRFQSSSAPSENSGKPRRGFPAVFLDRDGTLNVQIIREGKPYPPQTPAEFRLFPDVPRACRELAAAGFVLIVATNQPDVGRGTQSEAIVSAMHAKLSQLVPEITRIETCFAPGDPPSHPLDRRRKPEPGMLLDATAALSLDLTRSWMIGDRWRDIDCGKKAGVRTVFIDFGYHEALRASPDFTVHSFTEAAAIILAQH